MQQSCFVSKGEKKHLKFSTCQSSIQAHFVEVKRIRKSDNVFIREMRKNQFWSNLNWPNFILTDELKVN